MAISVEVSNLGPLRSAKADIADLTLLVGKNNTGKTFLATVLHRILNASSSLHYISPMRYTQLPIPSTLLDWIVEQIREPDEKNKNPFPKDPPREVLEWVNVAIENSLRGIGDIIRNDIEYAFGVEASKLRRRTPSRHASDCYLLIHNTNPNWKLEIRFDSNLIKPTFSDTNFWLSKLLNVVQSINKEPHKYRRFQYQPYKDDLPPPINRILRNWLSELCRGWPQQAVHFPAGRTGIMQSSQVLTGAVVRQASVAGIRPIEMEALPGTSADFLTWVLTPSRFQSSGRKRKTKIQELVRALEKKLGANIEVDKRKNSQDMILAVTPEGKFPMSRTSSMLSELAPILLILKGYIKAGDHLTIDEPEAHLHPEMQRTIASFLYSLFQCGIKILITTHSDFFLNELNNKIRSNSLRKKQEQTDGKNINIAALQFVHGDRWCESRKLEIDPIDGIDEQTFTEVMESLYDETADLIDALLE